MEYDEQTIKTISTVYQVWYNVGQGDDDADDNATNLFTALKKHLSEALEAEVTNVVITPDIWDFILTVETAEGKVPISDVVKLKCTELAIRDANLEDLDLTA